MLLVAALLILHCGAAGGAEVKTTPYHIDGGRAVLAGFRVLDFPLGDARVTWDLAPVNGVLTATATVTGQFYRVLPARASNRIEEVGLEINFKKINENNELETVDTQTVFVGACFGCGDNNVVRAVGVANSFSHPDLAAVTLTTFEMTRDPLRGRVNEHSVTDRAPRFWTFSPNINNGTADFGRGSHFLGGPQQDATVSFSRRLPNSTLRPPTPLGHILGRVIGTLYWDDFFNRGTARLIIDFQDANGRTLATRTRDVSGPGADANLSSNKRSIDEAFSSPSLFQVRLRTGKVQSNGTIVDVTSRICRIESSAAGTFDLQPTTAEVDAYQRLDYGFSWTVPSPRNWHDLKTLQLRFRDRGRVLLTLLFDEATESITLLDEKGRPRNSFRTRYAELHMASTFVAGSGPSGPTVTMNLSLGFKPRAAGRTLVLEVAGSDDFGNEDAFKSAGSLTIRRKKKLDLDQNDIISRHRSHPGSEAAE